jgi:hypothetical protein
MWLVGIVVLLAATATVSAWLGRRRRAGSTSPPWDIPVVASTYTGIAGVLAGFAVASSVFLANLGGSAGAGPFAATMGMFLIAFAILAEASQMFSTLPTRPAPGAAGARDDTLTRVQCLSFLLATVGYFIGLSLSLLGLRPLLLALGLHQLADIFTWLLLLTVLGWSTRLGVFLYRLTRVASLACLAVPWLGVGAAAAYWLVATRFAPALWPAADAPLRLALVAAGLAGLGFAVETALLTFQGDERLRWRLRAAEGAALAYVQAVVTVIALLWFAVVKG